MDIEDNKKKFLELRSEGRTYEEIARVVKTRVGTVKSRLHHALEKLRQMNLAVNLFTSCRETRESKP